MTPADEEPYSFNKNIISVIPIHPDPVGMMKKLVLFLIVLLPPLPASSSEVGGKPQEPPESGLKQIAGSLQEQRDEKSDAATSQGECEVDGQGFDQDELIESVRLKSSQGDYQASLDLLAQCRRIIKDPFVYKRELARIYALAGQSAAAINLTEDLLKNSTHDDIGDHDYEVYYARAVALHYANRNQEAIESLQILKSINPSAEEAEEADRLILNPLQPLVEGGSDYFRDTDSLSLFHQYLRGVYFKTITTRIQADVEYNFLRVESEPSLKTISGGNSAWSSHYWIGGGHRFSPKMDVGLKLGGSQAKGQGGILGYFVALNTRANDALQLLFSRNYDYYPASPRTVSLGIKQGVNTVHAEWKPAFNYVISGNVDYSTYSDGNKSWEVLASAQRKFFLKTQGFQVGPAVFFRAFSEQLDNGYYDPELYQRYAMATSTNWYITDDLDIYIDFSLGVHKDEEMDGFDLSYNANVEGQIALEKDWKLTLNAGTMKDSALTGAYSSFNFGASVMKRF